MMPRSYKEPFVSDPQLFIDYYTKQSGSGPGIGPSGLGNEFGSLRSKIIPLGKPKPKTDKPKIQPIQLSPVEAAVYQAKEKYKREQAVKKTVPKKRKSKSKPKRLEK